MSTRKQPTDQPPPEKETPPAPAAEKATPPADAASPKSAAIVPTNPAAPQQQIRDGFDVPDDPGENGTLIGAIEKYTKGDWTTAGAPADSKRRLLAVDTLHCLRRWQDKRVIQEIHDRPLPKVDDLNKAIPENEWEIDPNSGEPRPPWEHTHVVYLWDLDTGKKSTFLSSTVGGAIAVSDLKEQVRSMRRLRGELIYPQVELGSLSMKTKHGMGKKPDFKIVGWLNLNEMAPIAQIATEATPDDSDDDDWGK
jgi:hypothetical protein